MMSELHQILIFESTFFVTENVPSLSSKNWGLEVTEYK